MCYKSSDRQRSRETSELPKSATSIKTDRNHFQKCELKRKSRPANRWSVNLHGWKQIVRESANRLEDYWTVFQAELLALSKATDLCSFAQCHLTVETKNKTIAILFDSRSALDVQVVSNSSGFHPLAHKIRENAAKIKRKSVDLALFLLGQRACGYTWQCKSGRARETSRVIQQKENGLWQISSL